MANNSPLFGLRIGDWDAMYNAFMNSHQSKEYESPAAAIRIENTPFTSARYAGGMTYQGKTYTYFEPAIAGHAPNPDGSRHVAWLMVRDDFKRWVEKHIKAKQKAEKKEKAKHQYMATWFEELNDYSLKHEN